MTLMEMAQRGEEIPLFFLIAQNERMNVQLLMERVAKGQIVIPYNRHHEPAHPQGFGHGLSTKVSASIGLASDEDSLEEELIKVDEAIRAGTNAIMDLSTAGDMDKARREIIKRVPLPLGTLPVYQAFAEAVQAKGSALALVPEDFFRVMERQAADGVDFMALHSALHSGLLKTAKNDQRVLNLVSRGGSLLMGWMLYHDQENFLYTMFDRILEIAKKYEVTLSLADAMRPGAGADSLCRSQAEELVILGELVKRSREAGVQIMIKGPGHTPPNQIAATVKLEKQVCQGAPYFVFGPVSTDIAPGYDEITAAIGGAMAGAAGADILCYVTPAEHIGYPDAQDVYRGVVASRIAAHVADLAKGYPGAEDWDLKMSQARRDQNVEAQKTLALDQERLTDFHSSEKPFCHKCEKDCAMAVAGEFFQELPWEC
ncbi:phosphomethylpyrimidine synthase ThiC [Desulfosporosinus youngiae]|uniref:Phosphomethylpyrimidine synthase n=1 Tax=Desulfosporosinus youngiae DSM 17734 TaxID=768710 RepID=H5Y1P4_9FIRM|nr:thiamine biosynthesis protein ThiC [Desulfosporosinus youngiae DSM 17734]